MPKKQIDMWTAPYDLKEDMNVDWGELQLSGTGGAIRLPWRLARLTIRHMSASPES